MKRTFLILAVTAMLVACGNKVAEQKAASDKDFQEQCRQTIEACSQLEKAVGELSTNTSYERICEVQKMT